MSQTASPFTGPVLSGFCMQVSILLKSAVPLYEGIKVMAEDAPNEQERTILEQISGKLRLGVPFHEALKESESFPPYVENMVMLGEKTGLLDSTMEQLAEYYDKEYRLAESLRKAVTYPAMMILMLLVILFILFTRVMPVFSGVYEQLGTSIPPAAEAAIRFGGLLSGAALVVALILLITAAFLFFLGKSGIRLSLTERLLESFKSHSATAVLAANRRICSVLSMSLQCGIRLEDAFTMAIALAGNKTVETKLEVCRQQILSGKGFYNSIREAGLFDGFELQMIRISSRAGQLERVMNDLAEEYGRKSEDRIESLIARLEPTIVSVLAIAVGLVLLSVMLPLAGILSSIG